MTQHDAALGENRRELLAALLDWEAQEENPDVHPELDRGSATPLP
jgi:hypothetical protein